jgi:tetratricopeptide (TPR) repeat protein
MARTDTPETPAAHARPGKGRGLLARISLLVGVPALFFCGLEGALRVAGFGRPTEFFIPDGDAGVYRTNPNFTAPFMPASFGIRPLSFRIRMHKPANTLRVFVLGESAAQGIPDPDFGIAPLLRAQLRARFPGRSVEVYNLGITAIDSHVVYRIVSQAAGFEPDLFVVYMGNNEVVGPYGPGCAYMSSTPPVWLIRASVWAKATRTGQLVADALARLAPSGSKARDWKGMETFSNSAVRGDDPKLEAAYANFGRNLQDILDLAWRAGTRTVLATVVANLRDSAPFVSLHREGLSAEEKKSWEAAYDAGRIAWDLGDPASARASLEEALRIDPQFAEASFRLGRAAEAMGDAALARKAYADALHWDALRFRPDPRVNEAIRRAARGAGKSVTLVDAAMSMGSDPASDAPPPGGDILFDHVHFNWTGNNRLALQLAQASAEALSPGAPGPGPWLDAAGCASALGYTPQARLKMLQVVVQLMLRPPFTGQINFSENQAALKRDVEAANAEIGEPGEKSADIAAVDKALQLDPDNAALAGRLGAMESDAGDPSRALSLVERAGALEPAGVESALRKAEVLMRLRRFDEAEALLLGSVAMDEVYYSPSRPLVELWAATGRFDKGEAFFARELARAPSNSYLRVEYANLLARSGDAAGSERQALRIWGDDPSSRPAMAALELLVRQYGREGRAADAAALTREARSRQPGDYYNNQRLVGICTARGDAAGAADALLAMAASGPFGSGEHLALAHRLADLNRLPEMLDELAQARAVARIEGDERQGEAVDSVIGQYRRRFSGGQSR